MANQFYKIRKDALNAFIKKQAQSGHEDEWDGVSFDAGFDAAVSHFSTLGLNLMQAPLYPETRGLDLRRKRS